VKTQKTLKGKSSLQIVRAIKPVYNSRKGKCELVYEDETSQKFIVTKIGEDVVKLQPDCWGSSDPVYIILQVTAKEYLARIVGREKAPTDSEQVAIRKLERSIRKFGDIGGEKAKKLAKLKSAVG